MGCFSGCLMSSASLQKLFCGIYSAFKCSFDELVEEKVVSPSYSAAILGSPPLEISLNTHASQMKMSFLFSSPEQDLSRVLLLLLNHFSRVRLCVDPIDGSLPGFPSLGFSRQEYWSGLPLPSPGDFPDPGIEPTSCSLASRFFTTTEPPGKPLG